MSAKPSNTRRRKRPGVVLLLDENICSADIADVLRRLPGWTIELHGAHLDPGAPDPDVVAFCGQRRWALVTCDEMRHSPETVAAITRHQVTVFKVVIGPKTHGMEIAASLVHAREDIVALLTEGHGAVCAHIRRDGTVTIMRHYEAKLTESQRRTHRKYGARLRGA